MSSDLDRASKESPSIRETAQSTIKTPCMAKVSSAVLDTCHIPITTVIRTRIKMKREKDTKN
jgi:hypothetical protein